MVESSVAAITQVESVFCSHVSTIHVTMLRLLKGVLFTHCSLLILDSCRTKHITKYHFIREGGDNREIKLKHCNIEEQLAGIFTKELSLRCKRMQ